MMVMLVWCGMDVICLCVMAYLGEPSARQLTNTFRTVNCNPFLVSWRIWSWIDCCYRFQWPRGLRNRPWSLGCWDHGFEYRLRPTQDYKNKKIRGATGSDEPWPAAQPPLAVFPDCTRRYWVDMWSAHRIPQLHFTVLIQNDVWRKTTKNHELRKHRVYIPITHYTQTREEHKILITIGTYFNI
jgi:hypothetical protein